MVCDIVLNPALREKAEKLGFEVFSLDKSLIINTESRPELMSKISRLHSKNLPVIVLGSTDEINRAALEDKRVDMLLSPEEKKKKDFMHFRNSGLNHILCRFASQNNIKIGISFSSLARNSGKELSLRLGRIMQNIMICRKYRTKLVIASFAESPEHLASPYELKSLGFSLGMTPSQANESLEAAKEIFNDN